MEKIHVLICGDTEKSGHRYFTEKMQRELDKTASFIRSHSAKKFNVFLMLPENIDSSISMQLIFPAKNYLGYAIESAGKEMTFQPFLPKDTAFPEKLEDLFVSCSLWESINLKGMLSKKGNFTIHRIRIKPASIIKNVLSRSSSA